MVLKKYLHVIVKMQVTHAKSRKEIHMNIIIGNEENFDALISGELTIVDFFATWCGPCKMLSPVLEELANDRSEVKIVKIDVDENQNLAKTYGVMSVPTMILLKNGEAIATKIGYLPKEQLEEWIEENK